jgi:hypothetical protein
VKDRRTAVGPPAGAEGWIGEALADLPLVAAALWWHSRAVSSGEVGFVHSSSASWVRGASSDGAVACPRATVDGGGWSGVGDAAEALWR